MYAIQWTNQNVKQIHVASIKRRKTHAGKLRSILVLLLIGWESGERIFSQSQAIEMQNQNNTKLLLKLNSKPF